MSPATHLSRRSFRMPWSSIEPLETRRLFSVPTNFAESLVVSGLARPVSMTMAPDGRIFVAEQAGAVKVVSNGQASTFIQLPNVHDNDESGLLAIAFDPDFQTNGYVYLSYTVSTPTIHDRIVRVTAAGNAAVPDSVVTILDLETLTSGAHHGGMLRFGPDNKLYITIGDNQNSANSPSLSSTKGKILRINSDGSIPDDNPFADDPNVTGINRAIWARGLRNPTTLDFHRTSGRLFINDVGQQNWEEINEGVAGGHYGWPNIEGKRTNQVAPPNYQDPFHAYKWGFGNPLLEGCGITAGTFYDPASFTFPSAYQNSYFYADFCQGVVNRLDTSTRTVSAFGSGYQYVVGLEVDNQGALYVLERREYKTDEANTAGRITRITYTGNIAPIINLQPQSQTVAKGATVTFQVQASASPAPTYQWFLDDEEIPGATSSELVIPNVTAEHDGNVYRVRVSNVLGDKLSDPATLTVDSNDVPVPTIITPVVGATYAAGDTITYSGSATDLQDGDLPDSAFTWWADLHHNTHSHPFVPFTTGSKAGEITIPTIGETSDNVWYRLYLRVTDSNGASTTTYTDIFPLKVEMQFTTNIPGLNLLLDGQQTPAPATVIGVIGVERTLEAPLTQTRNGIVYEFVRWTDEGPRVRTFNTPDENTTFAAEYKVSAIQPIHLSDLNWASAQSPYTGVKKDLSTSGAPLRIGSQAYAKGIGVHSPSTLIYNLAGNYSSFIASVGIDDSVGNGTSGGSAIFQVWGDGILLKQSTRRTGADAPEAMEVDITGVNQLRLVTTTGGDNDYKDHADWADARLLPNAGGPVTPKPTVSITPRLAQVTEGALTAFDLTRTGDTAAPLTVQLQLGGIATSGADYTALPTSFTFAAGAATGSISLETTDDVADESNEAVTVSIAADSAYIVGSSGSATITIADNDPSTPPPTGDSVYLSDLNWTSAQSPYTGIKKDLSSNGSTLRIGGTFYTKGLGVHSPSTLVYQLDGAYTAFIAYVGMDDSVGNGGGDGSAVFQIWGDGVLLKQSTRRTGADGPELIEADLSGVNELRLVTTTGGDNDYKDHADWADAKLFIGNIVPKPHITFTPSTSTMTEGEAGHFTLTRTGDTTESLAVQLSFGGSATNPADYSGPLTSYVFAAGVATIDIPYQTVDDDIYEGPETIVGSVVANAAYTISPAATITLQDNETPPPASQVTNLSTLNWVSASSPYTGVKRNASTSGATPMRIGGVTYTTGVGVHAPSELVYNLGGAYTRFTAMVGIDDFVGNGNIDGSAQFFVYVDGVLKASSTRRTGAMPAELIDVNIAGAQILRLVTTTGGTPGDNDYKDHADWADAKLHAV